MYLLTYLFTYIIEVYKGKKFMKGRKWHVKWLAGSATSTIIINYSSTT